MQTNFFVLSVLLVCAFGAEDGLVPIKHNGRIVGGTSIPITTAPWQVSIQYFGSHRCGASLVYNSIVVSSAACVNGTNVDNLLVRGGSANLLDGLTFTVSSYYVHPDFYEATFDYDVSVIHLGFAIEFSDYFNAVPIAPKGYPLPLGALLSISGWGATIEGGPFENLLQGAIVPVVSQEDCNDAYADFGGITPRQFCAGFLETGGVDICTGDAGSPAILDGTLVGVASWGYACGQPGFPGVYTSISSVREWLDQMLV